MNTMSELIEYERKTRFELVESPGEALKYMSSLGAATLVQVEYKGKLSRSGNTLFVTRFKAKLRTSKYEHTLSCWITWNGAICDWEVNGERVGTIELSRNDPVIVRIQKAIEYAHRIEEKEFDDVKEKGTVTLRERPKVIFLPERELWLLP